MNTKEVAANAFIKPSHTQNANKTLRNGWFVLIHNVPNRLDAHLCAIVRTVHSSNCFLTMFCKKSSVSKSTEAVASSCIQPKCVRVRLDHLTSIRNISRSDIVNKWNLSSDQATLSPTQDAYNSTECAFKMAINHPIPRLDNNMRESC